jgi:hypothetical protein
MSSVDGDDAPSSVDGGDAIVQFAPSVRVRLEAPSLRAGPLTLFFIIAVLGGISHTKFCTSQGLEELDDGAYHLMGVVLGRWEIVSSLAQAHLDADGISQLLSVAHSFVSGRVCGYIVYHALERCEINLPLLLPSLSPGSLRDAVRIAQVCIQTNYLYHSHQPLHAMIQSWTDAFHDGQAGCVPWKLIMGP